MVHSTGAGRPSTSVRAACLSALALAWLAGCGAEPSSGGGASPGTGPTALPGATPGQAGAAAQPALSAPPPSTSLVEVLRIAARAPSGAPFAAPGATPQDRLDAFARDSHGVLPPAELRVTRVDEDAVAGPDARVVRAQQVIDGYPVDGHGLVLALSDRGVGDVRGYFVRASGFVAPTVDRDQAIATASQHTGLSGLLALVEPGDATAEAEPALGVEQREQPAALIRVSAEPVIRVVGERAHLAWKVLLETMVTKPVVYVDAYDGSVIWETNLVRHLTTGTGKLRLADGETTQRTETFGVAVTSGSTHRLYSSKEGPIVWSMNAYFCNGGTQICGSEVTSTTSTSCSAGTCANFSGVDARFTSSHEYLENVLAFLKAKGLNSYDNKGARIRNFTLREGDAYDNAFYGGSDYIVIGDGSYRGGSTGYFQPLTTTDVIFHEMGHAVDAKSGGNFEYVGESGALSESWADMQAFAGRTWVDGHDGAAHMLGGDCVPGDWHVQEGCGQSDLLPASDDCGVCTSSTTCGDGVCADVETCQGSGRGVECSADCGLCTPTAVAGDEVCNHGNGVQGQFTDGVLRNLVDPKQAGQPDTYGGEYWQNPECGTPSNSNDQCGVHTNSGVGNKWFTLLARGGAGDNDDGVSYSVIGVGASVAYDVALRTVRFKSTSTDHYGDFAENTLIAAGELEAAGKVPAGTAAAAGDAWDAVGIPVGAGCDTTKDCNDGDACTSDACAVAGDTGVCSHPSVSCSDANACNGVETCDPATGCKAGTAVVCNDGKSCTVDACKSSDGSCYVSSTKTGFEKGVSCSRNSQCCSGRCSSRKCT